jgi:AMMECR1 domain-containing protein
VRKSAVIAKSWPSIHENMDSGDIRQTMANQFAQNAGVFACLCQAAAKNCCQCSQMLGCRGCQEPTQNLAFKLTADSLKEFQHKGKT